MRALVPLVQPLVLVGSILAAVGCGDRAPTSAANAAPSANEATVTATAAAPLSEDLPAALAAARADGKPVLVLVRDPGDAAGIDAGRWLAADAPARAAVGTARLVVAWKSEPPFADLKVDGSFLAVVGAGDGKPLRACAVPGLRAQLPGTISALAAGDVPAPADPLGPRLHDWVGVQRTGVNDPAAIERVRADIEALLSTPLSADAGLLHGDDLAYLIRDLGTPAQCGTLARRLAEAAPRGRAPAIGMLELADAAFAAGDADEAARLWSEAERLSRDESPSANAAARAMAAQAVGPSSPARAAWERRQVADQVVLVPDLATYAATIARWRADSFFPVLFQDDRFAPRFIAAFKPARVVIAPKVEAAAPDAAALRAAVLAAWSGKGPATSDDALRARLRELRIAPDGVVVTQPDADELAGALALAAGRFEGLEFIASPQGADGKARGPADHLDRAEADGFARAVDAALARWPATEDGAWRAITLAGPYPYRWRGPVIWGDTYCLDDLLGRDRDLLRHAVPGRLLGAAPRAAYQAMCSLFLQPSSALLFDTYDQNPRALFGHHRLAPLREALSPRLRCDLAAGEDVWRFRERVQPWSSFDALVVTSSGWPIQWSVPGTGTAEDIPVGAPYFAHMTHSGTAADPYDDDTIAGRALWGGAYFWFGASAEPFLAAFQPAWYSGRRIAAGAPFGALWRERVGQFASLPWRLITLGDPLCCLRREPMRRVPVADELPGERAPDPAAAGAPWAQRLREARWAGDRRAARALMADMPEAATLGGAELAMALEECLIAGDCARAQALWAEASAEARASVDARRDARIAIGRVMDEARGRGDREALLAGFEAVLGTAPAGNYVERWIGECEKLAKRDDAVPQLRAWLDGRVAGTSPGNAQALAAASSRLEMDRLIALPAWTEAERDAALGLLAALARADMPVDQLAERLDRVAVASSARLAGSSAEHTLALAEARSADPGAAKLVEAVKTLRARQGYFRDWLLLGPFAHGDHGSWEQLEAAAGAVDPAAEWAEGPANADGQAKRTWKRPFTAGDFGFIDLVAQMDPHDNVQAYALATVVAERAIDGWLLVGSDDGVTAWLDGKQIHKNPAMRAMKPDEDQVALSLAPGRHQLLLRIDQGGGGWGFCARLAADKEGKEPLAGVTLANPLEPAAAPAGADAPP